MKRVTGMICAAAAMTGTVRAQPALTIYNQNFGVVRDTVPLDLQAGLNKVRLNTTTALLEPDSVILRDPAGKRKLQIVEQNYRADPVSQAFLLSLFEGKTIDFLVDKGGKTEIVKGKIVRSGYVPGQNQEAAASQPIIEVDGQLRFALPGLPLFPSLGDGSILKPELQWLVNADTAGPLNAELSYVTGGMSWSASYNVVAPEKGDLLQLVGWVTMNNHTGKTFENARIKLLAGDVSKIVVQPTGGLVSDDAETGNGRFDAFYYPKPTVTQKTFDEYHLYTLQRRATLHDQETKQVEFVRAAGIKSKRIYVYDSFKSEQPMDYNNNRQNAEYGTQSSPKVWVMREFFNVKANGLGIPLPKGRMRFYCGDTGGALEFTGENEIDHTPEGERLRIYTGDAFDVVGQRRQTSFKMDENQKWADESFEIKVRNRKKEPVEVRVVEHLYRGTNWAISAKSQAFSKKDAQTVEFLVPLAPNTEKIVTYKVHYSW